MQQDRKECTEITVPNLIFIQNFGIGTEEQVNRVTSIKSISEIPLARKKKFYSNLTEYLYGMEFSRYLFIYHVKALNRKLSSMKIVREKV